jgi:protein SCO1/2
MLRESRHRSRSGDFEMVDLKNKAQSGILVCALFLCASASAQLYNEPVAKPQQGLDPILANVGVDQKLDSQVPLTARFRDENGQPVVLKQYFDKPVILTLVYYTCPMLCSEVLNGTASSLKPVKFDVGKEFNVVTISIDPKDTPGTARGKKKMMLARYGRHGADQGWHFLTKTFSSASWMLRRTRSAASPTRSRSTAITTIPRKGSTVWL